MPASESAFWQFSLRFYRHEGVPSLCLTLQDQRGVDVNILFLLIFLSLHQRRLDTDEVRKIDSTAAAWRTRVVQPLRTLRRDLKNGVREMDAHAAEALRTEIKHCELHAERLQQDMLERAFPAATVGKKSAPRQAAAANLAAYADVIGPLPADTVHQLLTLFEKEFREELRST